MKNLISSTPRAAEFADRLLKIWAERYLPDASFFLLSNQISTAELTRASALAERTQTAQKLGRNLYFYSKLAWLRTSDLLSDDPNVANLSEIRFLAQFLSQVFEKILEVYTWQQPPIPMLKAFSFNQSADQTADQKGAVLTQDLPAIYQLAEEFKPVLAQLHQQHVLANNPNILGFTTTQFHFSTEELLQRVTPAERLLLSPYFKFAEEQICIPWQQICAAAHRHRQNASILSFVEQMLAESQAIAQTVCEQILESYPTYESRRGKLSQPSVQASMTRDIVMFQAYLALCILEGSMASVEQKLLPLCRTVFPKVGVRSAFIKGTLQLLIDEIHIRFLSEDLTTFSNYARQLQAIFSEG
jgi:hypothetical protein